MDIVVKDLLNIREQLEVELVLNQEQQVMDLLTVVKDLQDILEQQVE